MTFFIQYYKRSIAEGISLIRALLHSWNVKFLSLFIPLRRELGRCVRIVSDGGPSQWLPRIFSSYALCFIGAVFKPRGVPQTLLQLQSHLHTGRAVCAFVTVS